MKEDPKHKVKVPAANRAAWGNYDDSPRQLTLYSCNTLFWLLVSVLVTEVVTLPKSGHASNPIPSLYWIMCSALVFTFFCHEKWSWEIEVRVDSGCTKWIRCWVVVISLPLKLTLQGQLTSTMIECYQNCLLKTEFKILRIAIKSYCTY